MNPTLFETIVDRLGISPVVLDVAQLLAFLIALAPLYRVVRKRPGVKHWQWIAPMIVGQFILVSKYVHPYSDERISGRARDRTPRTAADTATIKYVTVAPAPLERSNPLVGRWSMDSSADVTDGRPGPADRLREPGTWTFEAGGVVRTGGVMVFQGSYEYRDTVVNISILGASTDYRIARRSGKALVLERVLSPRVRNRTYLTKLP